MYKEYFNDVKEYIKGMNEEERDNKEGDPEGSGCYGKHLVWLSEKCGGIWL